MRDLTMMNRQENRRRELALSLAAAAMGRAGGPARARVLSPRRRKEIAKKAAAASAVVRGRKKRAHLRAERRAQGGS
jgi:hypothetical protein